MGKIILSQGSCFFKILFIYLSENDTPRTGTQQGEWESEKQAPR